MRDRIQELALVAAVAVVLFAPHATRAEVAFPLDSHEPAQDQSKPEQNPKPSPTPPGPGTEIPGGPRKNDTPAGPGTKTPGGPKKCNGGATGNTSSRGSSTGNAASHGGSTTNTANRGVVASNSARGVGSTPGSHTVTRTNGTTAEVNRSGSTTAIKTANGNTARFGAYGRVASIHTAHGATVILTAHGGRTIRSERVNPRGEHIRVVSAGRRDGYVDHTYMRGGRPYMRRTYYANGHYYARFYPGYYYRGYAYYGYAPAYYYGPAYYGWAYNQWAAPVNYRWGWAGAPWYGYYGNYFSPYPAYPTASLWLTDYLFAVNLSALYQAQIAGSSAPDYSRSTQGSNTGGGSQQVALTPEVKQAIADEVKAELAAEKDEAAAPQAQASAAPSGNQVPAALNPKFRTFIVSAGLSEPMADGKECSLSQGDVLTRIDDNPDADQNVKVLVSSSQRSDCNAGVLVSVAVTDLQDMHNAFREKMDDGLKTLADDQGKNGLPAAPATGGRANPVVQAQPDQDVAAELQKQQQEADAAEKDVAQANTSGGSNQNQ